MVANDGCQWLWIHLLERFSSLQDLKMAFFLAIILQKSRFLGK
jgi:hypothetical protein